MGQDYGRVPTAPGSREPSQSSLSRPDGFDPSRELKPVMLNGLSWQQALSALRSVDCAVRLPHWCSPVVILQRGHPVIDDDGEIKSFVMLSAERRSKEWMMVPRVTDEGKEVQPDYRWRRRDTDRSGEAVETRSKAQPKARAGAEGIAQPSQPISDQSHA